VFPLHLPPLRERRDDIQKLILHFIEKCAARLNKRIDIIPDDAIQAMMRWSWPGNIRELENFIERSVILSKAPGESASRELLKESGRGRSPVQKVRCTTGTGSHRRNPAPDPRRIVGSGRCSDPAWPQAHHPAI